MSQLAPQRETRVTEEIRSPMGWLVGRTYRVAQLLDVPEIMELVQRVVTHLDNYCAVEDVDPQQLQGDVLPTRSFRYITVRLGSRPCWACNGSGLSSGSQHLKCGPCEGTGVR